MVTLDIQMEARIGSFELKAELKHEAGITIISGPSGSGKSSLLRCVAGLHKPETGHIKIGEQVFFDSSTKTNRAVQDRGCGFVMQNLALFPHMNVAENILFGVERKPKAEQEMRLEELVLMVKLEGLERRKISELSGGQLQRVALARALAPVPQLLLLDEPFSALELELREELGEELKNLQRSLAIPLLMVTHMRSEALTLADTLVIIEAGNVKSQTRKADLNSSANYVDSGSQLSW